MLGVGTAASARCSLVTGCSQLPDRATVCSRARPVPDFPLMKHWEPQQRALDLLSKEVGYVRKPHGGRLRVALAFPNTYFVGMSNLGFQTVYKLFNAEPDVVCERFFLPPKQ